MKSMEVSIIRYALSHSKTMKYSVYTVRFSRKRFNLI